MRSIDGDIANLYSFADMAFSHFNKIFVGLISL